jgi:hypothetical protein
MVTALAKIPALTFAVGAQLVAVAAAFCMSGAIAVLAMINLLKIGLLLNKTEASPNSLWTWIPESFSGPLNE